MKIYTALAIMHGVRDGDQDLAASRIENMAVKDAVEILAHYQITGPREKAARRVARELTTKYNFHTLLQWVYNGDYNGTETIASLQTELDEVESK